jgi:hypothetical protein
LSDERGRQRRLSEPFPAAGYVVLNASEITLLEGPDAVVACWPSEKSLVQICMSAHPADGAPGARVRIGEVGLARILRGQAHNLGKVFVALPRAAARGLRLRGDERFGFALWFADVMRASEVDRIRRQNQTIEEYNERLRQKLFAQVEADRARATAKKAQTDLSRKPAAPSTATPAPQLGATIPFRASARVATTPSCSPT